MATLTTPKLAFPYPDGTERVMDGDNAIGALALAVENVLHPALRDMSGSFVRATGQLVIPQSTETLIPGCSIVLNPTVQELAIVWASFDFNVSVVNPGILNGAIYIDGVTRSSGPAFGPASTGRETVMGLATIALNPGTRTITMCARKQNSGGTATVEYVGVSSGAQSSTYMFVMRLKAQPALMELGREVLDEVLGETLNALPAAKE